MDVNQWQKGLKPCESIDELAENIFSSAGYKSKKGLSCFSAHAITVEANLNNTSLAENFSALKQTHKMTEEKAQQESAYQDKKYDLMQLAVIADDIETTRKILGVLPEQYFSSQRYGVAHPAFIAVSEGRADIVTQFSKLSNAKDIFSIADPSSGSLASHNAARSGYATIIADLAELPNAEKLLNNQKTDGFTPAHLAAMFGHANVISELERLPFARAIFITSNKEGEVPAHLAAASGHTNVITEMAKSPAAGVMFQGKSVKV